MSICVVAAAEPSPLASYLQRYHKLAPDDVEGRVRLAAWCGQEGLSTQQVQLLAEVLKLKPDHPTAYGKLLEADAARVRPAERDNAAEHRRLLDGRFRIHRSPHFTLLSDADEETARLQLEHVEASYATFYSEFPKLGLRPMPPADRLVCILFVRAHDFQEFQRRFEGNETVWGAGHYSRRSNRVSFYDERDSIVFTEARGELEAARARIRSLEAELRRIGPPPAAGRGEVERELHKIEDQARDLAKRLANAERLATLSKTRHEVTHQLLFNSGVQRRGREYPFWLSEGLATLFEVGDADGNASPAFVSPFRLKLYQAAEKEGKLLPLADLITYQPGGNEAPDTAARRYTEAWALMHFLWNRKGERLKGYLLALEKEGTPRDWRALFGRHFGDARELENELRQYAGALKR